jgi:DNA-binding LytR/AlgR family response regulator
MKFYLLPIAFFYLSTVTAQPIPSHLMLWDSLARVNPDTALAEMQRTCPTCFTKSQPLNSEQQVQLYIGSKALFMLGEEQEAKALSEFALKQKDLHPWLKGKFFANIGAFYQYEPNYGEAAHYFTEAMKQFEMVKDTFEYHKMSVNATSAAWRINGKPEARHRNAYASALTWLKEQPQQKRFAASCALNFAQYLADVEKSDSTIHLYAYVLEHINLMAQTDRFKVYLNMGVHHDQIGDLKKAKEYYDQASANCCATLRDSCNMKVNLGVLALKQGNMQLAKTLLNQADALLANGTENHDLQQTTWSTLSQVYEKLGDDKRAFTFFKKGAFLSDSLFSFEQHAKLTAVEEAYDNEKLKNQILQHETESTRNKWLIAFLSLCAIGTAVFAMNRRKIAVISTKNAAISAENAAISAEKRVEAEAFAALLAENNSVLLTENAALVQAVALANDKNASRGVIDDKEAVPAPGAILDQYLQIKDRNQTRIRLGDIIYAEILDRRLHFHLVQGKSVQAWITMRDARDQYLPSEHFVQIHRSFIINRNYISHITNESVFMRNQADGLVIGDEFRANLSD